MAGKAGQGGNKRLGDGAYDLYRRSTTCDISPFSICTIDTKSKVATNRTPREESRIPNVGVSCFERYPRTLGRKPLSAIP